MIPSPDILKSEVAHLMGLPSPDEYLRTGKTKYVVRCRRILALVLHKSGRSYKEITRLMNRKDHTTALHALKSATPADHAIAEEAWRRAQKRAAASVR